MSAEAGVAGGAGPERAGWSRGELTLRMSKRRSQLLRRIAARMPAGATPTDAIDEALELALREAGQGAGAAEAADDIRELRGSLEREAAERRDESARIAEALSAHAEAVEGLRRLISRVADGGEGAEAEAPRPRPLREWLAAELARGGGLGCRELTIAAAWRSAARMDESKARAVFDARLISVDGVQKARPSPRAPLALDLDAASPLVAALRLREMELACAAAGRGWTVRAYANVSGERRLISSFAA